MKKIVLVLAVIIGILCINKTEKVIIPKESIRLRVIANSDCSKDQNLKNKIVETLTWKEELVFTLKEQNFSIKEIVPCFNSPA